MNLWKRYITILIITFSISRILFLTIYIPVQKQYSFGLILNALFYGIRYDLSVISYLSIPIFIILCISYGLRGKMVDGYHYINCIIRNYVMIVSIFLLMVCIIDIGFYFEFHSRLNYLVFDYINEMDTIISTIILVYPFNILIIFLVLLIIPTIYFLRQNLLLIENSTTPSKIISGKRVVLFFVLMMVAIRGGIQDEPINLGTASISNYRFINHLSMNPVWNLGYSFINSFEGDDDKKFQSIKISIDNAQNLIRENINHTKTDFINSKYPLLRKSIYPQKEIKYNVVIIIMESFFSNNIGVFGNNNNLSPNFDQLSKQGLLFSRFFSSGTRTNSSLASILLSFPALPRFKSILNDAQVEQPFSSLATLLQERDYETSFLYSGDINDDNIYTFFSTQGYDNIRGEEIFSDTVFSTSYGIADEYLYKAAKEIILESKEPYFLTLLNISNHQPYEFPKHVGTQHIFQQSQLNKKQQSFKYADWALGQFMNWNKNKSDYENTIYVILGDHGYIHGNGNKDLSLNLSIYNVPCLIIAPGIQHKIITRIASQIDVIPTILPLLGGEFIHNSWGKNLLEDSNSIDYALITPSGTNHLAGLISDKYFLIYNFQNQNKLYALSGIPNSINLTLDENNPTKKLTMEQFATSFIKLGLFNLNNYKCGIPKIQKDL